MNAKRGSKAPRRTTDGVRPPMAPPTGLHGRSDDGNAFMPDPGDGPARIRDDLAENLAEDYLQAATQGPEVEEDLDRIVPEEFGGPFVETTAAEEFAQGVDARESRGCLARAAAAPRRRPGDGARERARPRKRRERIAPAAPRPHRGAGEFLQMRPGRSALRFGVNRHRAVALGLAAVAQVVLAQAAHAESLLAQAGWPPPAGMAPPPPVVGPRVILQVDNANGRLQQHTQLRWRDVCIAPCGTTVDPAALYRIGGGTSLASEPFQLPRASGDVYIDAQVGSKVKHWVGLGLMIGGAAAALYGAATWALFNGVADSGTSSDGSQAAHDSGAHSGSSSCPSAPCWRSSASRCSPAAPRSRSASAPRAARLRLSFFQVAALASFARERLAR